MAKTIPGQAEDRERIAVDLNDIVTRRLAPAGLDLKDALALLGDHPARDKIRHAAEGLDQAIQDIRDQLQAIRDE
ncbi:MAG TPA: histidine kinase [Streptosporangiaceae bacterium]|nr:histidine kinase [Streptosporangiaceae bacterium]